MFGLNAYALPRDLSSNERVEKECVTSQLRKNHDQPGKKYSMFDRANV